MIRRFPLVNILFGISILGNCYLPLFSGFESFYPISLVLCSLVSIFFLSFHLPGTLASIFALFIVSISYIAIAFTRTDGILGLLPFYVCFIFTSTFAARLISPITTNLLYLIFITSFSILSLLSGFSLTSLPISTSINSFGFLNLFFTTLLVYNLYLHRRLSITSLPWLASGFVFSLFTLGASNIFTSFLLLVTFLLYCAVDVKLFSHKNLLLLAVSCVSLILLVSHYTSELQSFSDNLSLFALGNDLRFNIISEFFATYKLSYLYSFYDTSDLYVTSLLGGNLHNSYLFALKYIGIGLIALSLLLVGSSLFFWLRNRSFYPFLFVLPFALRGFSDQVLFFNLSDIPLLSVLFLSLIPRRTI